MPVDAVIVVGDLNSVVSHGKVLLDPAPRFLEVRKTRCSHPHYEMFILGVNPLSICACGRSLVDLALVPWPWNARLDYRNLAARRVKELESVIEVSIGWVKRDVPMVPQGLAIAFDQAGSHSSFESFPFQSLWYKGDMTVHQTWKYHLLNKG